MTLKNYYQAHNTVMRSGSTETVTVGAPNTKRQGSTELQRQAVRKQGVALLEELKNKATKQILTRFPLECFLFQNNSLN